MNKVLQLTAIIEREGDAYVATCQELDVVSQGRTVEEARLNLLEAVEGSFEVASESEIRRRLKRETYNTKSAPGAKPLLMGTRTACGRERWNPDTTPKSPEMPSGSSSTSAPCGR